MYKILEMTPELSKKILDERIAKAEANYKKAYSDLEIKKTYRELQKLLKLKG